MGIECTSAPLKRRLETLAAGTWVIIILYGSGTAFCASLYILFFTKYWFIMTIYLIWIHFVDYNTCDEGGRRSKWSRRWTWWKHLKDYYPFKVEKLDGVELVPERNYLFCAFPHGILPAGAFLAFTTDHGGLDKLFPHHSTYLLSLPFMFLVPFYREFYSSLGFCSCSAKSVNWLLKYPGGGKIAVLVVGGAAEAIYSRPGKNTVVLKNRKGYAKLALKSGTPIVPIFTFGEADALDQVDNSEGTLLRSFQEFVKRHTGVAPVVPKGRGFFQNKFGFVPHRRPLTMIIGKPLEVQKVENPTQEEIDSLHKEFISQLIILFDENKHKYVQNPQEAKLIIK